MTATPQVQPTVIAATVAPIDHPQPAEHLKAHTIIIWTLFQRGRGVAIGRELGTLTSTEHVRTVSRSGRKNVGTKP